MDFFYFNNIIPTAKEAKVPYQTNKQKIGYNCASTFWTQLHTTHE